MSVVRISERPYCRVFFKIKYMRILSGYWKLSVLERCPYREVRLYFRQIYFQISEKYPGF